MMVPMPSYPGTAFSDFINKRTQKGIQKMEVRQDQALKTFSGHQQEQASSAQDEYHHRESAENQPPAHLEATDDPMSGVHVLK